MNSKGNHNKGESLRVQIQKNHSKGFAKRRKTHKKRLKIWILGLGYMPGSNKRSSSHKSSLKRIIVPTNFSYISNTEECIIFHNRVLLNLSQRRNTYFDLSNVENISNEAIVALLSVVSTFRDKKVLINGNFPTNKNIKDIFIQSRFFDYVGGNTFNINTTSKNRILTQKNIQVKSDVTSELVSDAVETVFGERGRSTGIQRALIELMGNTFEHASISDSKEIWWLSVFHELDKNKVCFAFVDNGLGILDTIKHKPVYEFLRRLKIVAADKVLKEAMKGIIGSRYKIKSRGQGLPSFITSQDRESFGELVVISNNAIGKISQNNYLTLSNSFKGTLFYWEFDNRHKWIK